MKIAIIKSEYNPEIVNNLLEACIIGLNRSQFPKKDISTFSVPGAFEIPLMAKKIASTKKFNLIIALGVVIKGQTDHYQHICQQCSRGIMQVQLETEIPIIFEVLMVTKEKYARARSSLIKLEDNKGLHAAEAAIKLLKVIQTRI